MKLFLIYQEENDDYDTFDAAVVAAESEDDARKTCPDRQYKWSDLHESWTWETKTGYMIGNLQTWANKLEDINVNYLGEAAPDCKAGVICASFNAG